MGAFVTLELPFRLSSIGSGGFNFVVRPQDACMIHLHGAYQRFDTYGHLVVSGLLVKSQGQKDEASKTRKFYIIHIGVDHAESEVSLSYDILRPNHSPEPTAVDTSWFRPSRLYWFAWLTLTLRSLRMSCE